MNPENTSSQADLEQLAAEAVKAATRDPRNTPAVLNAAELWLQAGRLDRALEYAEIAVAASPKNFAALRVLSGFLALADRDTEALEVAQKAINLQPEEGEIRLHIAGLLMKTHRFQDAAKHLVVYTKSAQANHSGWRLFSGALTQLGRIERAIEAIDRAIEEAPNEVEYRLHRASLLANRGRYGEALDELDVAIQQAPDDFRIPRAMSGIHEALGDISLAFVTARQAVALNPNDGEISVHFENIRQKIGGLGKNNDQPKPATEDWLKRRSKKQQRHYNRPSFLASLAERWRVIYALMLRDMRTRFSKSRLGYVWAIFEPISHLMTLGLVFSFFNEAPPPVGHSLFLFYCTGLLPYLMYAHVANDVMNSLSASGSILLLPGVKTTDVMIGRALLDLATEIIVGIIVFSAFGVLGFSVIPVHLLVVMQAVLMLWLLGLGIGAFNMVVQKFIHSWETWFNAIVRLLYFASGIYYSPISMPDYARNILVWNPILQGVELFRSGFFPQYHPQWIMPDYLGIWVVSSLVIGFSLERGLRFLIRRPA